MLLRTIVCFLCYVKTKNAIRTCVWHFWESNTLSSNTGLFFRFFLWCFLCALFCGLNLLCLCCKFFETIYASCGVDDLLLTGIDRVTLWTCFNCHAVFCAASLKCRTTWTCDGNMCIICWMDVLFHIVTTLEVNVWFRILSTAYHTSS